MSTKSTSLSILSLAVLACLLLFVATFAQASDEQKNDKDELRSLIHDLSQEFHAEKQLLEQQLDTVYVEALQRKIAAISSQSDADYAQSLLANSKRLLQTVKLVREVKQKKPSVEQLTGKIAEKPARDCSSLRVGTGVQEEGSLAAQIHDGIYWVSNTVSLAGNGKGHTTNDVYKTRCDMSSVGGGWQLFGLKTKLDTMKDTTRFTKDYNRDRLIDFRQYGKQFNSLNLQRFDNLYGKQFEILVKVGDSLFDADNKLVLITNKQRTSGKPSDVSEALLKPWVIPAGEKCVSIDQVGRACLVDASGNELADSLKEEVNAFGEQVVTSFWIRN